MRPIQNSGNYDRLLPAQSATPSKLNQEAKQGKELYRKFNHFEASQTFTIQHSRLIPPVVVSLGELVGIIYRSDKDQLGKPQVYIHFMQDPPQLVSNVEGSQLYIVGGSYHITCRGIEG